MYAIVPFFLLIAVGYVSRQLETHVFHSEINNLSDVYWYIITLLFELLISVFLTKNAGYVVFVLLSPLMTYLSSSTEHIVTGKHYPFEWEQFWKDMLRAIRILVRNLIWQYLLLTPLLLLSFVFWGNLNESPLYPIALMVIGYYCGFSLLDYINERRQLTVEESIRFVRRHRGLALSIGGVFILLLQIQLDFNVLFLDFSAHNTSWLGCLWLFVKEIFAIGFLSLVPILSIIAATLAMHELNINKDSK
jgi:CysZ protein